VSAPGAAARPDVLPLVPAPRRAVATPGDPLHLGAATRVVAAGGAAAVGPLVAGRLGARLGREVPVRADDDGRPGAVVLRLVPGPAADGGTDAGDPPGAYRVTVDGARAVVEAADADGLRHGAATLDQLVVRTPDGGAGLRRAEVADAPRFGWRGLHLDVARHFHDAATVRAVLDVAWSLRLNRLHLHLTDDQGWRIEVPSRPRLTEVSGATAVDGDPGGFFTVADLAAIQAYGAERGITVVPEIDLPGHVNAALHAYPELTPDGAGVPPYTGIEVGFSRLHADVPATAAFVRDVLADVAAMTEGPYLHVGGDEALTLGADEYARLVAMVAEEVCRAGKTLVGWQEVARARLAPGSLVQVWDDREDLSAVADAARRGARVILSPARRTYLDQKPHAGFPVGLDWAGTVELRDAYEWEPADVVPGLPPAAVAGVEAALWTETIRTRDEVLTMLLPRLAAVAEVAWSEPGRRSWPDFAARVAALAPTWDEAGLPWYRSPQVDW
jgi:hexosaminidase